MLAGWRAAGRSMRGGGGVMRGVGEAAQGHHRHLPHDQQGAAHKAQPLCDR